MSNLHEIIYFWPLLHLSAFFITLSRVPCSRCLHPRRPYLDLDGLTAMHQAIGHWIECRLNKSVFKWRHCRLSFPLFEWLFLWTSLLNDYILQLEQNKLSLGSTLKQDLKRSWRTHFHVLQLWASGSMCKQDFFIFLFSSLYCTSGQLYCLVTYNICNVCRGPVDCGSSVWHLIKCFLYKAV